MRLKIFYLFVLLCTFAYANPANGTHDIILKGENHDNTVFGITLGKAHLKKLQRIVSSKIVLLRNKHLKEKKMHLGKNIMHTIALHILKI